MLWNIIYEDLQSYINSKRCWMISFAVSKWSATYPPLKKGKKLQIYLLVDKIKVES